MAREIGWGIKEKLLYKIGQIVAKKEKPDSQEIGWGVKEKLLYEIGKVINKGNEIINTTTTSTTTTP